MLPAPPVLGLQQGSPLHTCLFQNLFTSISALSLGVGTGLSSPHTLCSVLATSASTALTLQTSAFRAVWSRQSQELFQRGPWGCGPPASIRAPVSGSQPFPLRPSPLSTRLHSPPLVFSDLSHLPSELKMMLFSCFASQAAPGDEGGSRHPQEPGLASVFSVAYRQEPQWPHQAARDTSCSRPCRRASPFRSPGRFRGKKGWEGCWSLEHPVQTADNSPQADPANAQTGHLFFSRHLILKSDLQESFRNNTKNSCPPFTRIPQC